MLTLVSNIAAIQMLPDWTLVVQLLLFLAAFGILSGYIFKPMLRVIRMRENVTEGADRDASRINMEASDLEEKQVKILNDALSSFHDERASRISEAKLKSEEMIAETHQESQWFLETSDMFIEASEKSVAHEMVVRSKELASEISERLFSEQE